MEVSRSSAQGMTLQSHSILRMPVPSREDASGPASPGYGGDGGHEFFGVHDGCAVEAFELVQLCGGCLRGGPCPVVEHWGGCFRE